MFKGALSGKVFQFVLDPVVSSRLGESGPAIPLSMARGSLSSYPQLEWIIMYVARPFLL